MTLKKPPKQIFPNANICKEHVNFIKTELYERVRNGFLSVVGRVGHCQPPIIVMPMTVEPSKPRLCHDDRYINLWTVDNPFNLENLKHVPRLIEKGMYMTSCDEKSGYDHVKLSPNSSTYFGIQFGGWFLQYNTLPFGWKASAFIYQSIGMSVTSYLRNKGILTVQYIDDRLIAGGKQEEHISFESGENTGILSATRTLIEVMSRLGYTFSLKKSCVVPSTCIKYLGFNIDSVREAFLLPKDKKETFIQLREQVLDSHVLNVKTLQRFAGKCISMSLVVPAAKLYCREINAAISWCLKNSKDISVTDSLSTEISYWRFLDNWDGCVTWRCEKHKQIVLATDASLFKYGAFVLSGDLSNLQFGDYWEENDDRPIHLKESDALIKVFQSLRGSVQNHRVDLYTDNMSVIHSWNNQGGKDPKLNSLMKSLFALVLNLNVKLNLHYVPSENNMADTPSRSINITDSMLSDCAWLYVQQIFGPHTANLMAMDSNCMKDQNGSYLKHYTPFPTPFSAGVNVFAQDLSGDENPYVFPPFQMIFPMLKFLKEQSVRTCTIIVPLIFPRPVWWPFLMHHCKQKVFLGKKGDKKVLKIPTKKGFIIDEKGLKFDLLVARVMFPQMYYFVYIMLLYVCCRMQT